MSLTRSLTSRKSDWFFAARSCRSRASAVVMGVTSSEWSSVQPAAFRKNGGRVFLKLTTLAPGQAANDLVGNVRRGAETSAHRPVRLLHHPGRQIRVEP